MLDVKTGSLSLSLTLALAETRLEHLIRARKLNIKSALPLYSTSLHITLLYFLFDILRSTPY